MSKGGWASPYFWICPNDDCRRQVKPPIMDFLSPRYGESYCSKCKAWVPPKILAELARNAGE